MPDDEETQYQQAIVAERRAAYHHERDGYLRYGHTDRARAVEQAYEAEFGESMPRPDGAVETAEATVPRRAAGRRKRG